jgi:hypothetical protein
MNNAFFKRSIFIAVILALVFGFAYSLAQQVLRQGANDPQVQIAEDAVAALAKGEQPTFLKFNIYEQVDIAKSLAPFLITFDGDGKPLVSTAVLNGKTPVLPKGVLAYAKVHSEDRVTWQPVPGVRIAAVVAHYSGQLEGYALAGRSLRETENRSFSLEILTFWAWLATTFFAIISSLFIWGKK